ncbi:hypothetical protein MPSEU_000211200 [Mayamaea pseudoterrestris]|nr:hypothetical protein MPSEU_000211200 [Mayamaea pseudoterrestris]
MACFLHPQQIAVDASAYDGIEINVACEADELVKVEETFNVHLKTSACIRPFSSYRASFQAPSNGQWKLVRIPWSHFRGRGPGAVDQPLDVSTLLRAGIVAIGKPMKVVLGVSSFRFYKEADLH